MSYNNINKAEQSDDQTSIYREVTKMKRILAVLLAAVMLCGTMALATEPDGYVATGGWIPDQQTYSGTWQQAYVQILNNHSSKIHAYQNRPIEYYLNDYTVKVPCKPVSLTDITADGIPELIFMEVATEERGDLYIYSADGGGTKCILYVPGITRIGYDDAGMNFDIYLSSAGGGTLVLEYDEYEWPWVLQLTRNAFGQYTLLNYLWAEYDNSNEDNDRYYRNGAQVSEKDFTGLLQTLRNGRTTTLSNYTTEDISRYGFTLEWEDTVTILNGDSTPTAVPTDSQKSGDVYGLTIDKLATRKGPGTQYDGGGTYNVKNEWIKVLAKAWDKRNGIWWVKCEIPYHGKIRVLWTGWKRFDHSTISLDDLPEEKW